MKKLLILGIFLIVINSAAWLYFINAQRISSAPPQPQTAVQADVVSAFIFTMQDEVKKKVGVPIEGYEPEMFLQVFPGLVETDFDGVEASIGQYVIENGRLVHELGQPELIHSAATAVTRQGMATLLNNIAARTGIDFKARGTLTEIMSALTSQKL